MQSTSLHPYCRPCRKCAEKLYTAAPINHATLVETFENERLGLCANVRELLESNEFEVAVVDAFSGDVVVCRIIRSKEAAIGLAKNFAVRTCTG